MSLPPRPAPRGATLYFDCFAGIAGDMTLAALLDLGVPEEVVRGALACLPLSPFELRITTVRKGALMARKLDVLPLPALPPSKPAPTPSNAGGAPSNAGGAASNAGGAASNAGGAASNAGGATSDAGGSPSYAGGSPSYAGGSLPYAQGTPSYAGEATSCAGEATSCAGEATSCAGEATSCAGESSSCAQGTPPAPQEPHAHLHAHSQTHSHEHSHAHGPEHSAHDHSPLHKHRPTHAHEHSAHEHAHDHAHEHSHDHAHDHAHDHEHEHLAHHPHVHYAQIRALIEGAGERGLAADVIARALSMFDRLAAVEAALHGVPLAEVAFHEVGALDSIVDIVGVAAALSWLSPRRIVSRRVALGGGTVRTAHGLLPVPAPATLALLCDVPVEAGGPSCELTTPTGAVILAANVSAYGPLPPLQVLAVGHGAGTRELADRPNLLRIIAGYEEPVGQSAGEDGGDCLVLETNLDDMNPQIFGPLLGKLLATGARDVWLTPVQMKKGRPGTMLSVLCDPGRRAELTAVILRESTSLGVRSYAVQRTMLRREHITVRTEYGDLPIKLGRDPKTGEVWNATPEFTPCATAAEAAGVPVKQVLAAALAAYERR